MPIGIQKHKENVHNFKALTPYSISQQLKRIGFFQQLKI
jgi:hypothetical protein